MDAVLLCVRGLALASGIHDILCCVVQRLRDNGFMLSLNITRVLVLSFSYEDPSTVHRVTDHHPEIAPGALQAHLPSLVKEMGGEMDVIYDLLEHPANDLGLGFVDGDIFQPVSVTRFL